MSILLNKELLSNLAESVKENLNLHHNLYSLPVKGELWENLLSNSMKSVGIENDWEPDYNHAQGVDLQIDSTSERVSCKSGAVKSNDLEFSGSRMTKYLSFDDKMNFLMAKRDDVYMLLSRDTKEWNQGIKKYYFICFPSSMLAYDQLQWQPTIGTRGAYKGKENGFTGLSEHLRAKIQYSMSHQIWTTIANFKSNKNLFIQEIQL